MRKKVVLAIACCAVLVLVAGIALSAESVKYAIHYPAGYRTWAHVKSMVIQQGHPLYETFGGIHHIYANSKALEAMKTGALYPDGSILVFDLLEAKTENNAVTEGPRKMLYVMQKSAIKFAVTGGWGFGGFKDDSKDRSDIDPRTACFACHEERKQNDFVFTNYR
ncbi:MAG: cytochrome P460 family protein [Nitrospiraceae bacterium]|nr:cytochrome P460 family protein [Nitrospiraceae bacterium]